MRKIIIINRNLSSSEKKTLLDYVIEFHETDREMMHYKYYKIINLFKVDYAHTQYVFIYYKEDKAYVIYTIYIYISCGDF